MKGTPCRRWTSCLINPKGQSYRVGTLTSAVPPSAKAECSNGTSVFQYSTGSPRKLRRRGGFSPHESATATATAAAANPVFLGPWRIQIRGKRTKSSMRLEDLPQGPIGPAAAPPPSPRERGEDGGGDGRQDGSAEDENENENENEPQYPTVVLQARRNMRKFDSCVLLTRVGGFYELYFEHAEEYGPLLNLKVAQKKTSAGPVPMAGFPFFQLERYLKTLVLDLNSYVAIAEEFPNDPGDKVKSGGLMHDRRVTRIITSGTLIDENFIDPYANNYVMAIHLNAPGENATTTGTMDEVPEASDVSIPSDTPIGLAWLDISTGQFYTQSAAVSSLSSILSQVAPREIVVDEILESQKDHDLFSVLAEDKHHVTFAPRGEHLPLSEWTPMLESEIPSKIARSFTQDEVCAGSLLLQYVRNRLLGMAMRLQSPLRHESLSVMTIDKTSMRSLEIKQTIRDGTFSGSLLHAIRGTVTKGGARLLNAWLSAPSTSLEVIRARQDLVEAFIQDEGLRDEIVLLLRRCHDSQRLVQKFAFGRGDADDMLALANTIHATQDIVSLLESRGTRGSKARPGRGDCFKPLLARINLKEPAKLASRIKKSIDEEGLILQHQNEDSEASQLAALAEGVVAAAEEQEGEGEATTTTKTTTRQRRSKKGTTAAATTAAAAKKKKRKPASIRDHYHAAASADDNVAFVMKPGASPALRGLHAELSALLEEKAALVEALRERYDAPSLTLRWTPNLGHICHVKGKDARNITATMAREAEVAAAATTEGDDGDGEGDGEGEGGEERDKDRDRNRDRDRDRDREKEGLSSVSASRSTRALHLPEWTRLGQRIHRARFEIAAEERRLLQELRALVVRGLVALRRNAAALDELDVLAASFARHAAATATASREGSGGGGGGSGSSLTRPVLDDSTSHAIIGGRHPTVEAALRERGRSFTKNDCLVGCGSNSNSGSGSGSGSGSNSGSGSGSGSGSNSNSNSDGIGGSGRLWLITGPNMAGKSTYLRQNALITVLAQAGSWVPADHARLGVVDAIYSRVGSAAGDSLHRDQSTFMVEMLEAAQILRRATPRSLVVMDEVGRGTTPRDGAAVAFAALHHLVAVNRCRALFATHFHVLADWARERGLMTADTDTDTDTDIDTDTTTATAATSTTDTTTTATTATIVGGNGGGRRRRTAQPGPVEAYCTDIEEDGAGGFVYVHKLKRGVNRRSHALKVARLAGLPEAAIAVAREILLSSPPEAKGEAGEGNAEEGVGTARVRDELD